jgi:hypothetical protein
VILKENDAIASQDARLNAGSNHEKDVAYYLRREFADAADILILNDIRVEHAGEKAQIDHLILHPKGFLVIESKSVCGELKVNAEGEWSRSYKGQWMGIPSPIRQAEIQGALLRDWLSANRERFFDKLPVIGKTLGVTGFDWQVLCAVSSNAILYRESMPRDVSDKVIKAEFIAVKVREITAGTGILSALVSSKPLYSQKALNQLAGFILDQQSAWTPQPAFPAAAQAPRQPPVQQPAARQAAPSTQLSCRKCGKCDQLTGLWGKFGYYVKCGHCQGNTPMKRNCPGCGSANTRVSKQGERFSLTCEDCSQSILLFSNQGATA